MLAKAIHIGITVHRDGNCTRTCGFDGYAYLDSGFLVGSIGQGLVLHDEATLLTAFTLTGCPIAARCEAQHLNPWVYTRGAYRGRRRLVGQDFSVESLLQSRPEGSSVEMELDVSIKGTLPQLSGIARPFQEEISQRSRGRLAGQFDIDFRTGAGCVFTCSAETEYQLDIPFDVQTAWRNITIVAKATRDGLTQVEQIDMFHDRALALEDLNEKRSVVH